MSDYRFYDGGSNPKPRPGLRALSSACLAWLHRFAAADFILFIVAMLLKLYCFSALLAVQYMNMTATDAVIETGALLLISCWTLLLPTRGRLVALVALNAALSFLLYADVLYYRFFQDLISVSVLPQLGQLSSLGGSIAALSGPQDMWLFADLAVVLPFAVYTVASGGADLRSAMAQAENGRLSNEPGRLRSDKDAARTPFSIRFAKRRSAGIDTRPHPRRAVRLTASLVACALGAALFFVNIHQASQGWAKGMFEKNWWNLSVYNVMGGIGFHGYDLYRYARLHGPGAVQVSAEQKSQALLWMEQRGQSRAMLENDASFGKYAGSNVLTVQFESLQSFVIGKSIGGQEITPVLNELLGESAYFTRFYQQTGIGRTSDADFAASCSLYPTGDGSVFIQYPLHDFQCLPELVAANGYGTTVFHPYQGGYWNRNVMYRNIGYDKFYNLKHFEQDEPLGWSIGDKSFYRQSMDVIAEQKMPFYSLLVTLASHHPYKLPESELRLNTEQLDGTILGDYLQAIHYADEALGQLIDRLRREGLWDNTIFVLYGDHDNGIADWHLYERFMDNTESVPERERLMKTVPFLVHLPDGALAGSYDTVGGQVDIAPTLLHLLGISSKDAHMAGLPLLLDPANTASGSSKPLPDRLIVQRNGAWSDNMYFFIPTASGPPGEGACYLAASGEQIELSRCSIQSEQAELHLSVSDRIVRNNLLAVSKKRGVVAAAEKR